MRTSTGPEPDGEIYRADAGGACDPIPGDAIAEPVAMAFEDPGDTPASGRIFVIDGPNSILRVDLVDGRPDGRRERGRLSAISPTSPSSGTVRSSSRTEATVR